MNNDVRAYATLAGDLETKDLPERVAAITPPNKNSLIARQELLQQLRRIPSGNNRAPSHASRLYTDISAAVPVSGLF